MKIYPAIYSVQNGIVELLIPDFPGMLIEGMDFCQERGHFFIEFLF